MKRKLTSKTVEHLKTLGPKRLDVWDTALQGFGVRISPTGRKAWFVMVRPHGRPKRVTIGTYPAISLADARDAAGKIIRDAQLGLFENPPETARPAIRFTLGHKKPSIGASYHASC